MTSLAALAALAIFAQAPYPPAPPEPARYGDAGTSHLGVTLGLGTGSGGTRYAAGVDYGYFVIDGLAPGVETYVSGGSGLLTTGYALANLRVVPIRTGSTAIYLVGRGGRVFIESHPDLWGLGGSGGIIQGLGGRLALQIGYEYLRLLPADDCKDLVGGCALQSFVLGIVIGF
jgi:hypothetical protein